MLIGYARLSTDDQNTKLQIDALKRAGCKRIFGYADSLPCRWQIDLLINSLVSATGL